MSSAPTVGCTCQSLARRAIEFVYDGNGNRYEKRVNGTSTFYVYDSQGNIILEYDVNNIVKVRYIRDASTGRALAMEQAGGVYHFIYNEHGDVRKVVNSSGQVVAAYSYDEFGNTVDSTGTIYNPLRYSGANNACFDSETGLYKMGARYYKPDVGRWITRDTWSGHPRQPQTQMKYVYCENSPVSKVDCSGQYGQFHFGRRNQLRSRPFMTVLRTNAAWSNLHRWWSTDVKALWFASMVRPGGPWDLKHATTNKTKVRFMGRRIDRFDFGNIHYGYAGYWAGYKRTVLLTASFAVYLHTRPVTRATHLDEYDDWTMIKYGYYLARNRGKWLRYPWAYYVGRTAWQVW